jgi:uncharacterized protein
MQRVNFKLELKSLDQQGVFEGLAAVYGNTDLQNEVIERGAFTRTLAHKNGEVPILWQHDPSEPIGMGQLTDTSAGLVVRGQLAIDSSPVAQKAYGLLKLGIVKGLSVGFDSVKAKMVDGVRRLSELRLWEVSLVTFGANPSAVITGVKSEHDAEADQIRSFRRVLAECTKSF